MPFLQVVTISRTDSAFLAVCHSLGTDFFVFSAVTPHLPYSIYYLFCSSSPFTALTICLSGSSSRLKALDLSAFSAVRPRLPHWFFCLSYKSSPFSALTLRLSCSSSRFKALDLFAFTAVHPGLLHWLSAFPACHHRLPHRLFVFFAVCHGLLHWCFCLFCSSSPFTALNFLPFLQVSTIIFHIVSLLFLQLITLKGTKTFCNSSPFIVLTFLHSVTG